MNLNIYSAYMPIWLLEIRLDYTRKSARTKADFRQLLEGHGGSMTMSMMKLR